MHDSSSETHFTGLGRRHGQFLRDDIERRAQRRFSMSLPVTIRLNDEARSELRGSTLNVSCAGAFIFVKATELRKGDPIELTLELPAEVTLTEAVKVRCHARILRIEREADGVSAIAVQISDFDFLAST